MAEPHELVSILGVLLDEGVEFVLVGALAAVAQGAPVTTHDVDIVHARTPENLDRLMAALARMNTRYRGRPASSPLRIESAMGYDELVPLSIQLDLGGRRLAVLGLDTIVSLKRKSGTTKDQLMLPVLEETLRRAGR